MTTKAYSRGFALSIGGNVVYAKMPGGSIKLPLAKKERDETIAALREALSIFDDASPRDDATESG